MPDAFLTKYGVTKAEACKAISCENSCGHLLPTAAGKVQTQDNRGPYDVTDAEAIIAASFADQPKLQIDENHAEDLKSGKGEPSPARGWITELQARADGIWGKVEWTGAGRALVADKAYRAMSPVILHDKAKKVVAILRASLVNRPNLKGLVSLNQEQSEMDLAKLAAALGLGTMRRKMHASPRSMR